MAEDFVDMCAFCKQGVPRTDMVYQKGKVFHSQCFTDHGNDFAAPDSELAELSARTRIELVQLKNMKARAETGKQSPAPAKKVKKGGKKSSKKKKTKKPARRLKAKRIKSRARKIKKRLRSRKSKTKSRRRR